MNDKKVALIILGTNNYLPLAINLIQRLNFYYKGESRLTFHLVSDTNPDKYLNLNNLVFHHRVADSWDKSTVLKLDMCKEIANDYDYDYIGCLDADSNIFRDFTDDEMFYETFVVEHISNANGKNSSHYEKNKLSSAYVDPQDYQKIYFQTCYFGGTKEKLLDMVNSAIHLRSIDQENGIIARWTDEAYLQIYLMKNPPAKIFNPHNLDEFPIYINDKGSGRNSFQTGKARKPFHDFSKEKYEKMMERISELRDMNVLWNFRFNEIVVE